MITLDTAQAFEKGYIDSLGGLFRGETAQIVGQAGEMVIVVLPNSLYPEKQYCVDQDCLIVTEEAKP